MTYGDWNPMVSPVSQRLPHWLRVGIAVAYQTLGIRAPMLEAHSTRDVATSIVMKAGFDWNATRALTGQAGDLTFMRFCHRDV